MKIRLLSDLHAEGGFDRELYKSQGEDVLVLAGDIQVGPDNLWHMLKQFAVNQPNVVFTYGNHEFYRHDYFDTCRKMEEWSEGTSIKILNPGVVHYDPKLKKLQAFKTHDSIAIIGAPLWTNFRDNELSKMSAAGGINDFRLIRFDDEYFSPNEAARLFRMHYGYIKYQLESIKSKKLVVTHFLPAVECIDAQYRGQGASSTLNDYFANDLGDWISYLDDTTWVFGHTHSNVDLTIGTTRLVANPYGYGKNHNYKECLIDL